MTADKRGRRARVSSEIERAVMELVVTEPLSGQDRIARELRARRLAVSPSGVRYVWLRNNVETADKRVAFMERAVAGVGGEFSPAQAKARDRISISRRSQENAATMSPKGGTPERSSYIVAVAASLFRERGYDATSLRDIARKAEIPLGSLYYHFQSKDQLFATVYEEAIGRVIRSVTKALASTVGGWPRLEAAVTAHLRMLCEPGDFSIAPLAAHINGLEPPIRERLRAMNDHYENIYRDLIADLKLPPSIDPTLLRLQLLGAIIWTSVWFRQGKAGPDEIAAQLINTLKLPLV